MRVSRRIARAPTERLFAKQMSSAALILEREIALSSPIIPFPSSRKQTSYLHIDIQYRVKR